MQIGHLTPARGYTESMNKQRYSTVEVAEALLEAGGNAAEAARSLGCSWATVRRYIQRYPELRAVRRGARVLHQQQRGMTDPQQRREWWQKYIRGE